MIANPGEPELERYPEIEAAIGEDPARWLDRDLLKRGPDHTTVGSQDLVLARIRGIDYLGVVNAWIQVERELERGPRGAIIEALERRRDYLVDHGDREELSDEELAEARAAYEDVDEDDEEEVLRHVACGSTDVERESAMACYCHECDQRTNRVEVVEDPAKVDERAGQAVATDGGGSE